MKLSKLTLTGAALALCALSVTPASAQVKPAAGWYGEDYIKSCASNHDVSGCQPWTVTRADYGAVLGQVNWVYIVDTWHRTLFPDEATCQSTIRIGWQLTGAPFGWCEYVSD